MNRESIKYGIGKNKIFLSNFERKGFLLLVAISSDKGFHMSSANQTWIITWKIVGDGSWFNKISGDKSWFESINYCNNKNEGTIFRL